MITSNFEFKVSLSTLSRISLGLQVLIRVVIEIWLAYENVEVCERESQ